MRKFNAQEDIQRNYFCNTVHSTVAIAQRFHNCATFLLISSRNPLVIVTFVNYGYVTTR